MSDIPFHSLLFTQFLLELNSENQENAKGLEPIPQTNEPNHGFLRAASQANLGLRRTLEASQPQRQLHGMMRPRFLWMLMEMIRMYLWI